MIADVSSQVVSSRREAAKLLDVSSSQLGLWSKQTWFPLDGKTDAGWNVPVIDAARNEMGLRGSELSDRARQVKLATDAEKLRLLELKTEREELTNAQLRGELIPRQGFELFGATLLTEIADWISQVPDIIEQDVPKKYRVKLIERIRTEFDSKRRQTSATLQRFARELDAERSGETEE